MMYPLSMQLCITKTFLYNFDPLKPHFYIVKTGVYSGIHVHYFSYFCSKHRLWVFIRTAGEAVLTSTQNLCFEQKYEKYQSFLSENFQFLEVKFSIYLNRCVFVMVVFKNIYIIQRLHDFSLISF